MIIFYNTISVIGSLMVFIGIFCLLGLLISKIRRIKNEYSRIFTALFIPLTGLIIMWLITVNPVTINQKSVVNTSNDYPRPLNLSLKDKAKINYYYDSRFIDKRKDDMAFSIKSTELQKGETTNFKVIQKYRNEFFVPVIEKNEIKIKKI